MGEHHVLHPGHDLGGARAAPEELDFSSYYRGEDSNHFGTPVKGRAFQSNVVRNAIINSCNNPKYNRTISLHSGYFSGDLDLSNVVHEGFVRIEKCCFDGRVDLRHASFRRLRFVDCIFRGAFEADLCEVYGDVVFIRCEFRSGLAWPAAEIGGRLVLDDVDISVLRGTADGENSHGRAIAANMLVVRSGFFLRSRDPDWSSGTLVRGAIHLDSASVDGNLELCGVRVLPEQRDEEQKYTAIYMAGASLSGSLMLTGGCRIEGDVDIFDLRARLLLIEDSVILRRNHRPAFRAEMAKIETYLTVGKGAVIGGFLAKSCEVGVALYFGADSDSGPDGVSRPIINYEIDLTNAVFGRMEIDMNAWREARCRKVLDGASYRSICDLRGRILTNIEGFLPPNADPKVRRAVSQVLHDAGLEDVAADEYVKYKNSVTKPFLARVAWGYLTGYGVGTPKRLLLWYSAHLAFFSVYYTLLFSAGALCAPGSGACEHGSWASVANGFGYAVDTAVPVALGELKQWQPSKPGWKIPVLLGQFIQWAFSWAMISILIAYFSAVIWRKK